MKKILLLLKTQTAIDSAVVIIGIALSTLSGFLLTVVLARSLSPADYGLFITALAFVQLVHGLAGLGIKPAILNFFSSVRGREKLKFLKITFILRLVTAFLVGGSIYLLARAIAELVFKSSQMIPYLQVSALGVFFLLLLLWGQASFQAQKKFVYSVIANSSINFLRLSAVLALLLVGLLTARRAFLTIQVVLIFPLIFILFKHRLGFLREDIQLGDLKQILTFGLPAGVGNSLVAVYTRLDQILVFNLAGKSEAGVYGMAFQVASVFLSISFALTTVITPRYSSLRGVDFQRYFQKTILVVGLLGLLALMTIPVAPILLPFVFGARFSSAMLPFQILTAGAVVFILNAPFSTAILYRFRKPRFSLFVSLLSLILLWYLLSYLIPLYGSIGAAIAVTGIYSLQLLLSIVYFVRLLGSGGKLEKNF